MQLLLLTAALLVRLTSMANTSRRESDSLLSPVELADYLSIPVGSIYQWNHRGGGPRAIRVGRHVRYRMSDVQSWLDRQTVER